MRDYTYTGKQQVGILIGASIAAWVILIGVIYSAVQLGEKYVSAFSSY